LEEALPCRLRQVTWGQMGLEDIGSSIYEFNVLFDWMDIISVCCGDNHVCISLTELQPAMHLSICCQLDMHPHSVAYDL
jgi:hypothetical protein